MTSTDIPADTGDFRLVDRQVADVVRRMPEHARFLRGMFAWVGFRQEAVRYDRDKRFAGETHYPLKKMLKLLSVLGIGMLAISGLGLLALLILLCCGVQAGAWWLAALMVLCTGTVTTGLGVLGAYISRIYDETRARPLYIVGETRGFPADFTPFRR